MASFSPVNPDGTLTPDGTGSWNRVRNISGFTFSGLDVEKPVAPPVTLPTTGVSPGVSTANLTYYVRFKLFDGTFITLDQATHSNGELFKLNGFSIGDTQILNIGSQSSGRVPATPRWDLCS